MVSAILLAAGKGERLWPFTSTRPKPLLPVLLGESLLERWVKYLKDVDEMVVVVDYMGEMIERKVKELREDAKIVRQVGRGTAVATSLALNKVNDEKVIVVYSDVYFSNDEPVREILKEERAIVAAEVEDAREYGLLKVNNGYLEDIIEKPPKGSGLVNAGLYVFKKSELAEALKDLKPSPRGEIELTDAVKKLIKYGVKVIVSKAKWKDVGRPWDLLDVARLELDLRESEGEIDASVEGKVIVKGKPKVKGDVVVEGPAFIAAESLGPFVHIRPYTVLLEGVKIGAFVQVKDSFIMEGSRLPHLNYIGDSVIAEDVNMGAGSVTANLRFDESTIKMTLKGRRVDTGRRKLGAFVGAYAKIGVNASLMPGVRVGAGAKVYPGCVVYRDIPDGDVYKC